jgi:bifunctional UDP-N-acetylglucosamine pyrophosphorylase / glucosamine-1-phosphate N-acetyltransferase
MRKRIFLILAAGKGTRMKSPIAKVLHPLLGKPMLARLIESLVTLRPDKIFVVVGHEAEAVSKAALDYGVEIIIQEPQLGTAHALLIAKERLLKEGEADLLIVSGDVPLVPIDELSLLLSNFSVSPEIASLVSIALEKPYGYGRVLKDPEGNLKRIVEERDATPAQRTTNEVNSGIYAMKIPDVFPYIDKITTENQQGEYYLPDLFSIIYHDGKPLGCFKGSVPEKYLGINSQLELAKAEDWLRVSVLNRLLFEGVIIKMPDTVWVEPEAVIAPGVILNPYVRICGNSKLEGMVEVRSFSTLINTVVNEGSLIRENTLLENTVIGRGCKIGPYSHTREGTITGDDVRLGNFVETKKADLGSGVKANHLSYLGDVTIGSRSNIGAGTITCNYDGENKLPTIIGEKVFIGSDTQLVAPVEVGDEAYVGAGTTVTGYVPPKALAISRVPQKNIENWVEKRKKKRNNS